MVRALGVLVRIATRSGVLEVVGAALIVAAVAGLAGLWWALGAAGVCLLLKAFEKSYAETGP